MDITRFEVGPRFSEVTVVDLGRAKLIHIAGQVAENTSLDVAGQTREVLQFIDRLLAKVQADKTHVLSARIYLASVGDYAAMNSAWDEWVAPGHTPARSTIGARLIHPEYRVEIEMTAAVPSAAAAAPPERLSGAT
jgi:enamine deaminase RidA (YjgF/YER057c/UK114 family)